MKLKIVSKIMQCTVRTGEDSKPEIVPLKEISIVPNSEVKIPENSVSLAKVKEIAESNVRIMKIKLAGKNAPTLGERFNLTLKYIVKDEEETESA